MASSLRGSFPRITGELQGLSGLYYNRFLTSDGDPDGPNSFAVDGSITPVEFYVAPDPGYYWSVDEIQLVIADGGSPDWDDYGNIIGPLPNGCTFFAEYDGVRIDFPPIQRNTDYMTSASGFQFFELAGGGTGPRIMMYNELLTKHAPPAQYNFLFDGDSAGGDRFGFVVNDDLTTLDYHRCRAKGARIPKGTV